MRTTRWTNAAQADLRGVIAYIATDNSYHAQTVKDRIQTAADGLARYNTGRPSRFPNTYEKLVSGLPYILVYRVEKSTIVVLRLIHTAQSYPPR
ncbi:type II toxin-antitoxin system RelE/ParE family toxin [Pelagibacterium luteolum]|uniref:Plasmid stabilization system protein ParE n=1 Tax=Pelagibacterium luteolum TaxID=440168 RepID=A0A1G7TQC7_9HYPH|nr:type II toxin-antitoxin system RelE/ParE family toxin [Pelagibacterium luteolum]SDG36849.1 Plasmid stabilization system protein ParE [Pelagibacterium luteolum]